MEPVSAVAILILILLLLFILFLILIFIVLFLFLSVVAAPPRCASVVQIFSQHHFSGFSIAALATDSIAIAATAAP